MKNIVKALSMLNVAYGLDVFTPERIEIVISLFKCKKRTLLLENIEQWILTHPRAPYINELYEMSVECSDSKVI